MTKLYHYVHCPFCVRVRMALGYLDLDFKSIVLPYDDEQTPKKLTGVKMLPIAQFTDGTVSNESLDIIKKLDSADRLKNSLSTDEELNNLLSNIGKDVHSLCMPYWIWSPEFNDKSRDYFQSKKEIKRGPFNKLIHNKSKFISSLEKTLEPLETKLNPYFQSSELTIQDIMLASHLWGMYIFPEFQFTPKLHNYLQLIREKTNFNYHQDFWN